MFAQAIVFLLLFFVLFSVLFTLCPLAGPEGFCARAAAAGYLGFSDFAGLPLVVSVEVVVSGTGSSAVTALLFRDRVIAGICLVCLPHEIPKNGSCRSASANCIEHCYTHASESESK
jgi:hypothetical protein